MIASCVLPRPLLAIPRGAPVAEIVAPLVQVIVSASCMSAPLVADLPHTAYTRSGVRPVTLKTQAKVWLNCPHPKPLPFMEPVAFTQVTLLAVSKSAPSGAANMQLTCWTSPSCDGRGDGGANTLA